MARILSSVLRSKMSWRPSPLENSSMLSTYKLNYSAIATSSLSETDGTPGLSILKNASRLLREKVELMFAIRTASSRTPPLPRSFASLCTFCEYLSLCSAIKVFKFSSSFYLYSFFSSWTSRSSWVEVAACLGLSSMMSKRLKSSMSWPSASQTSGGYFTSSCWSELFWRLLSSL